MTLKEISMLSSMQLCSIGLQNPGSLRQRIGTIQCFNRSTDQYKQKVSLLAKSKSSAGQN